MRLLRRFAPPMTDFYDDDKYPSPDSNGYPAVRVGVWEKCEHVGICWREEYEWIAGNSF